MNDLTYHGAPATMHGQEDLSQVAPGSSAARKSFKKNYVPTGYKDRPAREGGAVGMPHAPEETSTPQSEQKRSTGLSTKTQLLLTPFVIAFIVILVVAMFWVRDSLFGDKSSSASVSAPETTASTGDSTISDNGSAAAVPPDAHAADSVPEPIADLAKNCVERTIVLSFYSPGGGAAPESHGYTCSAKDPSVTDVGYVQFTDDAAVISAVRDGQPITGSEDIGLEPADGDKFVAQKLTGMTTVTELLSGDKGVVDFMFTTDDPEAVKHSLKQLGVAK